MLSLMNWKRTQRTTLNARDRKLKVYSSKLQKITLVSKTTTDTTMCRLIQDRKEAKATLNSNRTRSNKTKHQGMYNRLNRDARRDMRNWVNKIANELQGAATTLCLLLLIVSEVFYQVHKTDNQVDVIQQVINLFIWVAYYKNHNYKEYFVSFGILQPPLEIIECLKSPINYNHNKKNKKLILINVD